MATTIVDPAPLRTPTDGGDLAATGSDSSDTLKIAGGVLIAGIGLVVVAAKTRRRPSPA